MNATTRLHELGQSLWLDNITRDLLTSGTLQRYLHRIFGDRTDVEPDDFRSRHSKQHGLRRGPSREKQRRKAGEPLFFELALEDLTQAAALFRPVHEATDGVDGWVSLEVSPLLANDAGATVEAAKRLHAQAHVPTCSSRFPARPQASRPSRNRSSPACR